MRKDIVIGDLSLKLFFSNGIVSRQIAHFFDTGEQLFESVDDVEQFFEGNVDNSLHLALAVHPVWVYYFVEEGSVGCYYVLV